MNAVEFEVYKNALDRIGLAWSLLEDLPIAECLDLADRLDALGPIVAPTLYIHGGRENARDAQELLKAGKQFQDAVRRMKARIINEGRVPAWARTDSDEAEL